MDCGSGGGMVGWSMGLLGLLYKDGMMLQRIGLMILAVCFIIVMVGLVLYVQVYL